jgi:hypothetical protein
MIDKAWLSHIETCTMPHCQKAQELVKGIDTYLIEYFPDPTNPMSKDLYLLTHPEK